MKLFSINLILILIIYCTALCDGLSLSRLEAVKVHEDDVISSEHSVGSRHVGENVEGLLRVRQRRKAKKEKETRPKARHKEPHHQREAVDISDNERENTRGQTRIHAREKNRRGKNNERQRGNSETINIQRGPAKSKKEKTKDKRSGKAVRHKDKHAKHPKRPKRPKRPKHRGSEERQPDPVPEGPWVRLVDGSHSHEGRIEVYVDGFWGSLCDDGFDLTDAGVICKQLGFTGGAFHVVYDGRFDGYNHLEVVMDDIECEGEESRVQDCEYITDHNCGKLTEAAQVVCKEEAVREQCPADQTPGLVMTSTLNLSLGVSGQTDHSLVIGLRELLDGTAPLVTSEERLQLDVWMQDETELSSLEMTVVNVKKIWLFVNYRDNTHTHKIIKPSRNQHRERPWVVEELLGRRNVKVTPRGLSIIVQNGGGSFSLADLKVYSCIQPDSNNNCPANSGIPSQLREGHPNLAVAVNGNRRHSEVTKIIQLLGGGYVLDIPSATLEISVWLTDKQPLSSYRLSMKGVDSLRVTHHYMNGRDRERIITRPNKKRAWSVEESFQPSRAGHPTYKLTVFFTARRGTSQFEIDQLQIYSCSPPDGEMPTTTCYKGDGENYRGIAEHTDKGSQCMNWMLADEVNPTTHPAKGLGNHNFCRNPDNDVRPWCWVSPGVFGYCDIPVCGEEADPRTLAHTTPGTCSSSQFTCGSMDCVPDMYVCDGEADCTDASDEDGCANVLDMFEAFPGQQLSTENVDEEIFHQVKYMFTSLKECAKRCLEINSFICRGFNYESDEESCILYNVNAGMVGLTASQHIEFYQLISQAVQCTARSHFQCKNGRCIQKHLQCNDIDNCHDFSDEAGCATPPPLELRLTGGAGEHEGQVQVKYMSEWGAICDDNWDIQDAQVVCRQLGYKGAIEATVMSRFGGNPNILLDNVECFGNETKFEDCSHSDWRSHDCRSFEAAGVVCRVGKVCTDEQFACGQAADMTCVPIGFVCDGQNDCSDGSDERSCDTIEVLLIDGHSEYEGRVEINRNGVRGTVCDDSFDNDDAKVICRMLGYDGLAMAVEGGTYGPGSGPIWVDDLRCAGDETDLSECVHRGWSSHNCMHTEDAGVRCFTEDMTTPQTPLTTTTTGPGSTSAPAVCGRRFMNQAVGRIVGGFEALYGAYPWQAGIRRMKNFGIFGHWCGGTILNDRWILSAAHCFEGKGKAEFRVRTGDWDNEVQDGLEQEFEVEEIYAHRAFTDTTYDYDVALVKIKPANGVMIQFNDKVQPACLPNADTEYRNGTRCIASGWGSTGWDLLGMGVYPDHLQAAIIPVIDAPQCRRLYKFSITERMFCAGYVEGNIDSCQGDSGGPLVCRINGMNTVLGVTSWGNGCAQAYAPGVYAKVTEFLPWIQQQMQN